MFYGPFVKEEGLRFFFSFSVELVDLLHELSASEIQTFRYSLVVGSPKGVNLTDNLIATIRYFPSSSSYLLTVLFKLFERSEFSWMSK